MIENISNRALISRLYSAADQHLADANYNSEIWSDCYNVVQELTVPEKMVYVIVKLNQTVTNGGFTEFYESSYGIYAPEVIYVLNEIKANGTADIVTNTLPIVNPTGLLDDAYKTLVFNLQLSEKQKVELYEHDIQYDRLDGQENLEDLLGDYLQILVKDHQL